MHSDDMPKPVSVALAGFSGSSGGITLKDVEQARERAGRELAAAEARGMSMAFFDMLVARHPTMHPSQTRWNDARLAVNAAQIEAVRSWDFDPETRAITVNRDVALAKLTDNNPPGLLLTGKTGRGKTRSLFALMERLASRGRRFGYMFAGDWFAELGKQVRYGRDDAAKWVDDSFGSLPILILDDIGQEAIMARNEEWAQAHFFRLLDLRLSRGLPFIASTNIGAADLTANRSGGIRHDPLVRRLCDLCRIVEFV